MLALDDAALARLVIAATAVPADQRGRWLRSLARKLEPQDALPKIGFPKNPIYQPSPKQRAGAARTRLCRKRQKDGYSVLDVCVNFNSTSGALFAAGLLQEEEIDDPAAVRRALEKIIALLPEL